MVYDENSKTFISMLTHFPQRFDNATNILYESFEDVDIKQMQDDFLEFLENLEREGYVIMGDSLEQVNVKNNEDIDFKMDIPPIKDLTIEITNRCNERCVHCYLPNQLKNTGRDIDIAKLKAIIDDFVKLGGETITLTGGEVFIHERLTDLLRYIDNKHLKIIIYSNLIALSDKMIKEFKNVDISYIQVSLYGINAFAHDSVTGVKGSCMRTIKSIEQLQKANIPVKIACPILKENKDDIINVLKFAKNKSIPIDLELNISPREDKTKDNLEHRLSIEQMESLLLELIAYDKDYIINLLHRKKQKYDLKYNFADFLNYPICSAGHYGLYLTAEGKVTTCPNMQGFKIDSIDKTSIKSIWFNNEKIRQFRRITEASFPKCINCIATDYCYRCFAMNYTETGDYMQFPNYVCEMAFLSKKIIENTK